jgi:urea transport system substrate-binding protein
MTTENSQDASTPGKAADSPPQPVSSETIAFVRAETPADLTESAFGRNAATGAWVGRKLGKYQITAVLGQGGMGVVLKAHDPMIERDVAIKVLAEHLAADALALERFLAEAKAAGKLNHPNVTAIYEIGQEGTTHYLVLEYVAGGSLGDRLEKHEPFSVLSATQALMDACKGVAAAHDGGMIHRDIKPANFMLAASGSIKIADFGLAKTVSDSTRNLTQAGMLVGTPFFMSPEQCEARPLDRRSDIYSLGATYYSLLSGKLPYQETQTVTQLMYLHCHGPVPDPRSVNPAIPEACSRIVARAMAKSPEERYQSAGEMLTDLQALYATLSGHTQIVLPSETGLVRPLSMTGPAGPKRPARRWPWLVAPLILLALIGLGLVLWQPWHKAPEQPHAAVPPPGDDPIKVGVLHSLSGTMSSSEAVVVSAVRFAFDEVNASGGVLGRPVKTVVADGRSDWPTFAREAERLISEEKVCTVFGCWTSASRKTVKPIFERHDNLLIYPLQFEGLEESPAIVYLGAAPNQQIIPAVEWAVRDQKKKRFFLIGSDYVFPRAAHAIIKDQLKRLGAQVAGEEFVPLGSQNLEAAVSAIVRAKPDMILNTINGDSNTAFFRLLRAAGVTPAAVPTLSFSVGEQELRTLNAPDAAGDFAAWTYFQSVQTPENAEFVRRFHDKYEWNSVTDPMETAYVGVKLWAAAVNEAQSLEPKKIRRALLSQHLKGPDGEVRVDADTQYCFRTPRIGQIQGNGQFKVVWTAPEPVRPEPYPSSRTAEAWRGFLSDLYTGWGNRWAAPETDVSKEKKLGE